jgi:FkbM family methyltransferase
MFDYLRDEFASRIPKDTITTLFELGCESGQDTLLLRDRYRNAAIYAFECNPDMLPITRTALANQPRITLIENAVWDEDGPLPFYPVTAASQNGIRISNPGASSCFRARSDYHQSYEQREAMVQAIRLDRFAHERGIDKIDLICMDLQGAELRALRGLGRLIRSVQYIISEIERKPIYDGQDLLPDVHNYLSPYGFTQVAEVYRDPWFSDYLYERRIELR